MAKKFPDLTGDGKVTMKDILKGRGVIKKEGGMMKKKQLAKQAATAIAMKKAGKEPKAMKKGGMMYDENSLINMHKQMAMTNKKFT